ncbi:MAG: TolC family protein [Helicobacteraceae bacterium]|jgi:cobalt-zinc-cadmium efflux system outer membrane protein|nr:TolC family protein [Helicobacteraceae bacterium]
MKYVFLMLLPLLLRATPLDAIIDNALSSHHSLQAIEERLNAEDYEISATRNFTNPEIAFGVNDIQFDDITDRSIEPMQTTSVTLKQKFPSFGKRDAATERSLAQKKVIVSSLEEAKVKLVEEIKMTAYSIWEVDEELHIIDQYIQVTRQSIDLNTAYSSTRASNHMGIMSAELALSQLKIKKSRFESRRKALYAKLGYLAAEPIEKLDIELHVQEPEKIGLYLSKLENNRGYGITRSEVATAQSMVKVQELSGNIDPALQVGYFYRQAYTDYVNVSLSMALPIYGSESDNTEAARETALSAASVSQDYLERLKGETVGRYAELEEAYSIYRIIHDESMPQIEHMFELTNSSVQSGQDLFVYIDLLKQKLALDEQLIASTVRFNTTEAALDALIGEIR